MEAKRQKARVRDGDETRRRLVEATVGLMLRQGYGATTVDQICAGAGLTKGSFFHHFASKEAVGLAAMDAFARAGMEMYAAATQPAHGEPLDELHRLLDLMAELARTHGEALSCMVGTLSQEMALSSPAIREAGERHMVAWVAVVADMLTRARQAHPVATDFDPEAVAWVLYSIWQGSMLIGKTRRSPAMIEANLGQARLYIDSLFAHPGRSPSGVASV